MNKFTIEHDLLFFASARWQGTSKAICSFLHNYAQEGRVFFLEPPCFATCSEHLEHSEYMQLTDIQPSIRSVVPVLPRVSQQRERIAMLQRILDCFLCEQRVQDYLTWYTHPFSLSFSGHLEPFVTLYDCLNEARLLSALSDEALQLSDELIEHADLVLLKRQKSTAHSNIYIPSHHSCPEKIQDNAKYLFIDDEQEMILWETISPRLASLLAARQNWPMYSLIQEK